MSKLSKKVIVITGGSTGIGLACAEECLKQGASVVISSRSHKNLKSAFDHLRSISTSVTAIMANVTSIRDVFGIFNETIDKFGRVDGVIHSAGIYGPIGPVIDIDPHEWMKAIETNLYGTFLVAREAADAMRTSCRAIPSFEGGSIVLMSGGGAASPFPNYTAYACGKIGVVRLAETMAIELKPHNIRVNAVAPGFVATKIHEQTLNTDESLVGKEFMEMTKKRLAEGGVPPEVAARTCAFLLSDESRGITGKFVAAPYDNWKDWPNHIDTIKSSDVFTLRRIVPKDRGEDWQ